MSARCVAIDVSVTDDAQVVGNADPARFGVLNEVIRDKIVGRKQGGRWGVQTVECVERLFGPVRVPVEMHDAFFVVGDASRDVRLAIPFRALHDGREVAGVHQVRDPHMPQIEEILHRRARTFYVVDSHEIAVDASGIPIDKNNRQPGIASRDIHHHIVGVVVPPNQTTRAVLQQRRDRLVLDMQHFGSIGVKGIQKSQAVGTLDIRQNFVNPGDKR